MFYLCIYLKCLSLYFSLFNVLTRKNLKWRKLANLATLHFLPHELPACWIQSSAKQRGNLQTNPCLPSL